MSALYVITAPDRTWALAGPAFWVLLGSPTKCAIAKRFVGEANVRDLSNEEFDAMKTLLLPGGETNEWKVQQVYAVAETTRRMIVGVQAGIDRIIAKLGA